MTTAPDPASDGGPENETRIVRDRATLLRMLDAIDREGWDSLTATALLRFLRERVVRPLAISVGLRGAIDEGPELTLDALESSGLGVYVAQRVVGAHGGSLMLVATNASPRIIVRLPP